MAMRVQYGGYRQPVLQTTCGSKRRAGPLRRFVSSAHNGSAGCDFELDQGLQPPQPAQYGLQVSGIASTPYNVAVGGTDFNDYFTAPTYWKATSDATTHESAIGYIPETPGTLLAPTPFLKMLVSD